MDREELIRYLAETYGAEEDHPWAKYPTYGVFRHRGNRKWFAAIMDVPKEKLGLPGGGTVDIVNVKCDIRMAGSFRAQPGIFPAYHMNKENWLSVLLDGTVSADQIQLLLEISHRLTAPQKGRTGGEA